MIWYHSTVYVWDSPPTASQWCDMFSMPPVELRAIQPVLPPCLPQFHFQFQLSQMLWLFSCNDRKKRSISASTWNSFKLLSVITKGTFDFHLEKREETRNTEKIENLEQMVRGRLSTEHGLPGSEPLMGILSFKAEMCKLWSGGGHKKSELTVYVPTFTLF